MRIIIVLLALLSPAFSAKLELIAGGGTLPADAPATQCKLREPFTVEFAPDGRMIIAEMVSGNRVLAVDKSGRLSLLAGTGVKGFSGDGGAATAAQFNGIHNLAIAKNGDIYLADSWNYRVRKLSTDGNIVTFAGTGKKGFGGDGAAAKDADFATLIQIALDPAEKHLFVADIENRRIRHIALDSGIVTTVAGNGKSGVPADGATAVDAPLSDPRAVVPAADGSFYVLERGGHALRFVDSAGKIRTVMGTGKAGLAADGSSGLAAAMNGPKHACLDRDGTVIIADAENNVVVRYNPTTKLVSRIAGTGKKGSKLTDDALTSELSRPHGVAIAPDGALIITDSYNDRVLKLVK